jgi:hypothetical protein
LALSMEEQRILDEMARKLADEDPRLALRLASLGRPGFGAALRPLRSPRSRVLAAAVALALIVVVSLMVYAMIPFRAAGTRHQTGRPASTPTLSHSAQPTGSARASAPAP